MSKFHLTVLPDGRTVITTDDKLTADEVERVDRLLEEWTSGKRPSIVIPDCDVVRLGGKP